MTASKLSGYEVARRLVGPFYLVFGITLYIALHRHFTDHPVLVYYAATLGMMAFTGLLEWVMPFHKAWQSPDDQFINEIGSTFISAFLGHNVGKVAAFALFGWFVVYWRGMDGSAPWWPSSLPFAVQVCLSFVIWEFGLYWNHRWMHAGGWRFHSLHHKLRRLSWLNSGYGHPIGFFTTSLFSYGMLALSGASAEVLLFNSFLSAAINFLSHANVDMKAGLINYIISAPEVHRWHHVKDTPEAYNKNFGTQLMVWDHVFGTFYLPKGKAASHVIGDDETYMPAGFWAQWLEPFRARAAREQSGQLTIPEQRMPFRAKRAAD